MKTKHGHLSPAMPCSESLIEWRRLQHLEFAASRLNDSTPTLVFATEGGEVRVLSSAINAEYRGLVVPHNHVSVSVAREGRASDAELHTVRHDFDMLDAEEDNHQPGRIRNLFLPLHLPRGTTGICDCKSDETIVVEPDGFTWSRPKALR